MYLAKAFGLKKPRITFFGGPGDKVAASFPFDLVINLSGNSLFDNVTSTATLPKFSENVQAMLDTPRLTITWPDFGLPRLPKSAWWSLAQDIKALAKAKRMENETDVFAVAVCCVGGTGRTGTCLAILKALLTGSKADPVKSIRDSYKSDAVETYSQIAYVEYVTGQKSREKVIPKKTYSTGNYSSGTSYGTSKSAKDSAAVFAKSEADAVCNSMGIECPATVKHTKTCDDKYHFQKTGEPAPKDESDTDLTLPVAVNAGNTCNGQGVDCKALTHLADCSAAFMAHHKGVIDKHKTAEGCNGSGRNCESSELHTEACQAELMKQAETYNLVSHPSGCICTDCKEFDALTAEKKKEPITNADITRHVSDCICNKCIDERFLAEGDEPQTPFENGKES